MEKITDVKELPRSILELIDVFIKHRFKPMTLNELSSELGVESAAINQRILRDENDLFKSSGKPKKIWIKEGFDNLVAYRFGNQCSSCWLERSIDKLTIQMVNPDSDNPSGYMNLKPVCKKCLEKPPKQTIPKNIDNFGIECELRWEYKHLLIVPAHFYDPEKNTPKMTYYKYTELNDVNIKEEERNWNYITKNNGERDKIVSLSFENIINAFGKDGWDVVRIITPLDKRHFVEWMEIKSTEYEVFLKRKITVGGQSNDK